MTGHLELVCAVDENGRSYLREQSFCAPMHISKPFLDEDVLVVNAVNPTAGLFAGDELRCRVRAESGARLLLTSPSASRAHRMIDGEARLTQEFAVARGGWLEVWPELLIPQGGTRYRQKTAVEVEQGGELLLFEMLAPGRVAAGEVFEFERLDFQTDVVYAGTLVARERFRLTRDCPSVRALRTRFPTAYYASCFLMTERVGNEHACWEDLSALHGDATWIGCSRLVRGGHGIKILAADSPGLARCVGEVRRSLYHALDRPLPTARKTPW